MSRRLLSLLVSIACLTGCPSTPVEEPDASVAIDATSPSCADDLGCDDGIACNGTERCDAGRCVPGEPIRCDDGLACTTDTCSEELRACVHRAPDHDGDGVASSACLDERGMPLGADCDDDDADVRPGALEVCDEAHVDEDCDPSTLGGIDADDDGFVDARCCNGSSCGEDCNDAVRSANPMGTETCNTIDDDCDGHVDEAVDVLVYRDADGDGRGVPDESMRACASTAGYSVYDDDCDDTSLLRSPALLEVCDGIDNDCDGVADPTDAADAAPWYRDADGDGFGDPAVMLLACAPPSGHSLLATDCDDTRTAVHPGQTELCNGRDDDCNGVADFVLAEGDLEDDDRDGIADARCMPTPMPADCDDRDGTSTPGAEERCDGRDNDCDGAIDESVSAIVFFRDVDADGYGSAASGTVVGCAPIPGYVARGGDCADDDTLRNPSARDLCTGTDEDCDGAVDEGPDTFCGPRGGREQECRGGACRPLDCPLGSSDCNGLDDGCETLGPCPGCAGGCAADQDCVGTTCVPCTPTLVLIPPSSAPTPPADANVRCFDGPESFTSTDCPVIRCGALETWPLSYTDNRFSLALSTYDHGAFVRETELVGPRYVYSASIDVGAETVTYSGQHTITGTTPWSTFRN